MRLAKFILTGLLVPALVAPSVAAAAVRPSVKAVTAAPVKQDRALALRSATRAGAPTEAESNLVGLPLLLIIAGVAATVALAVVVIEELESSPG